MKRLLQSKHFKKNLGKWLSMYVLCMGLFTAVITYSKYISNIFSTDESARVSQFGVHLVYCSDATCQNTSVDSSEVKKYRPYENMEYYFAIDSSELEVSAEVVLTAHVDRHFKIVKIEKITDNDSQGTNTISENDSNKKTLSFTDELEAANTELSKYKVTVAYDSNVVDYNKESCNTQLTKDCKVVNGIIKDKQGDLQYIFNEKTEFDAITIDYSITQTDQ